MNRLHLYEHLEKEFGPKFADTNETYNTAFNKVWKANEDHPSELNIREGLCRLLIEFVTSERGQSWIKRAIDNILKLLGK